MSRGTDVSQWTTPSTTGNYFTPQPVTLNAFDLVRIVEEDRNADTEAFDRLPPASRAFLSECPLGLNCRMYERFLGVIHEARLIQELRRVMPQMIREVISLSYGADHPSVMQ